MIANGIVAASVLVFAALHDSNSEGDIWGLALRVTARHAALLFLLSFTASGFYFWKRRPLTAWVLRNRRSLGLTFALVMYIHLGGIFMLTQVRPERFEGAGPFDFVPGALFFSAVGIMVLTSFARWKSRLTRAAWKKLHRILAHMIWFGFAVAFGYNAQEAPFSALMVLVFLAALALHWWGRRGREAMFATQRPCVHEAVKQR